MTKIVEVQIRVLEIAAAAVAVINKGIDKAQSAVVAVLNKRLDSLADEYLNKAAAITAAPHREADSLRDQLEMLTAEFIEEGERRRRAFVDASSALLVKVAACTSLEEVSKATAKADIINKARVELLARKK